MVASAATSAFFLVTPPPDLSPGPRPRATSKVGLGTRTQSGSSGTVHIKTRAHAPQRINGTSSAGLPLRGGKTDDEIRSVPPSGRTIINQLPDWSMLLAAITTAFLAAEKQWMILDLKGRRSDGLVFSQRFDIRSYEIGADRTASIETFMNHLQETALNHVKTAGILGDGFGSTPEMCKKNLIWVVARMQVLVDRYPTWGDVVRVDTWVSASGKNGMRRDWLLRDAITGETLTRASSVWVMMNKETRRLSKMPNEVRAEIGNFFVDSPPLIEEDGRKLPKLNDNTPEYIRTDLFPRWNDLDVNQHVNNVKYVDWILESTPREVMENHELAAMTLEYRRECGRDSVVESLTSISDGDAGDLADAASIECQHLLRLVDRSEVVRARTEWRSKHVKRFGSEKIIL